MAGAALAFLLSGSRDPGALADLARAALEPEGAWALEPGVAAALEAAFPAAAGRLWTLRERMGRELAAWAVGPDG